MSSDIVVTSALRNTLLSLQTPQKPGESAKRADAPAAQSTAAPASSSATISSTGLSGRVSDLQTVLDGINASVSTIEGASSAISEIAVLLSEAETIVTDVQAIMNLAPDVIKTKESDFNAKLDAIDDIVGTFDGKASNLLSGDRLQTNFGSDPRNTIVTQGADISTEGLKLFDASFADPNDIALTLNDIRGAQDILREFAHSLAGDLSVIQTRKEFTQESIQSLAEGLEGLEVTDQSEEGANLLALQTRQALSANRLPLASSSQQSVFKLF
ncbi:MAG: hypothetical protein ACPGRX_02430 [Bdellovibrionales bacterium]